MPEGHTYRFESRQTDYATCFILDGDKAGYLKEAVFPPVGTLVSLTGDRDRIVQSVRLDISNDSGLAMIYVECTLVRPAPARAVPVRVR